VVRWEQNREYSLIDLVPKRIFRTVNYDNSRTSGAALGQASAKPIIVASLCGTGTCPTIYRTDRGTVFVQGPVVTPQDAGIDVPAGEQLVEIPLDLLAAAMKANE
jgi:hypothetical protein